MLREGIPYTRAVEIAEREGIIAVNLYDQRSRMTGAVRRAVKKGLLKRVGGPGQRAQFAVRKPKT